MPELISIAAQFRFEPESDDELTIPGSIEEADPLNPFDTIVRPIVGYMAVLYRGRVSWAFMRYDAPMFSRHGNRMINFSTTRVAHLSCRECGGETLYPVWGKEDKIPCPRCGKRAVNSSPVKEGSPEFLSIMGPQIETELRNAVLSVSADEFRFPSVYLLGHLDPSEKADARIQGKAIASGRTVRFATESSVDDLLSEKMKGDGTGLLIDPAVVTGTLDADDARKGWTLTEGIVTSTIRMPWLPKPQPRVEHYGGCRF